MKPPTAGRKEKYYLQQRTERVFLERVDLLDNDANMLPITISRGP